jgi:hypothetical protein
MRVSTTSMTRDTYQSCHVELRCMQAIAMLDRCRKRELDLFTSGTLHHANIVRFLDTFLDAASGLQHMVLERLPGNVLDLVRRRR